MADVFISYARTDRGRVETLNQALREIDLDVWIDARLTPGVTFRDEIAREAQAAKSMIVCWTPGAVISDFVLDEAHVGKARGVLIPVKLSPCTPPLGFGQLETVDLSRWDGALDDAEWLRVTERLEALTRTPELSRVSQAHADGAAPGLVLLLRRVLIRQAVETGQPIDYTTAEARLRSLAHAEGECVADFDQPMLWTTLDAVAEENRRRSEPPLPCLVVNRSTQRPGRGYFRKHAFLVNDFDPMAQAVFERHLERVRGYPWPDA
ncbi:MAG: TIR domain-containing protein [Alphaproteobacteria bacterium]|nr:TIR domain-containing protein [Alphaproteobacteria bacterium]